jgi:dethiobiotin synthetase
MLKIAITGTDTSVGKTVVTCALIALLRAKGLKTAAMKPIETGVSRGEAGSDHITLAAAAGVDHDNSDICPLVFEDPLAPWVASRRASIDIDVSALDEAFNRNCSGQDAIIVEGAGGLLVPITRSMRFDGLFLRWGLELIIVAADRLGALNHTLLTIDAAQRAGLGVRGVVLNQLHKVRAMPQGADNATALRGLVPAIPVVEFPCVEELYGGKPLREHGAPMDFQLLRDAALSSGLVGLMSGTGGSQGHG